MPRPKYHNVDGLYVNVTFEKETVRSALRYKPQPDDLFVVGYPKCGVTWLQNIAYNIINNGPPPKEVMANWLAMPFLEAQGADTLQFATRPCPIKTHMPYRLHPLAPHAKYIYVTRNPYDCCVSFFYHTKQHVDYDFEDGTFDEFFKMFVRGNCDFGDYFDHLLSWYEHRDDANVLFLTFEGLKKDIKTEVLKIADFIGEQYGRKLRTDEARLTNLLDNIRISTMREAVNDFTTVEEVEGLNEGGANSCGEDPSWLQEWKVVGLLGDCRVPRIARKGIVGDWRDHFSEAQIKRLQRRIKEKTEGTDVMSLWNDTDIPRSED